MIKRLLLRNWLSHRESEIIFSNGKNLIIGYNGAGKTSIVEGIYFALFGDIKGSYRETIDRAKLIHHGEKIAEVELEFGDYRVVRRIKREKRGSKSEASLYEGRKLLAEGPDKVNKLIQEILGMDKEVFSNILYGGQEMLGAFLKQSPKEQKETLDKAFNIHKLKHYLELTKKLISEIEKQLVKPVDPKELTQLQEKLEKVREQLREIKQKHKKLAEEAEELKKEEDKAKLRLTRLKAKKERWEQLLKQQERWSGELASYQEVQEVREEDIAQAYQKVRELKKEVAKKEAVLANYRREHARHQSLLQLLADLKQRQTRVKEELAKIEVPAEEEIDLSELEKELGALEKEYETLHKQLQQVRLGKGKSKCPVCGRPLDPEHIRKLEKEILERLKQLRQEHEQRKAHYIKQKELAEKRRKERMKLAARKQALEKELEDLTSRIAQLVKEIQELNQKKLEEKIQELERELKDLRSKQTAYEVELKKLSEQRRRWERKKALEKELERIKKELAEMSFKEEEYERALSQFHQIKARVESLSRELQTLEQSLQTTQALHDEINTQYNKLLEEYERQKRLNELKKELEVIREGLELGQKQAREDIVNLINQYLPEFWESLSPTRYYQNPHLNYEYINKVVGHGYRFYIESPKGLLEAEMLSGGEKTVYILALKLTLVKILSKHSLLILDEPTQSLDEQAVKALSEAISQLTEGEVGQFIVITHHELLKEADWDRVIEVSKKGQGSYKYSAVEIY